MATPKYFKAFPDIKYGMSMNKSGVINYINIKDYFHLMRVRDDIFKQDTLYSPYVVKNGERPDQISYNMYGDEQYYWILLQINDIVDYHNQWPLSQYELDQYIVSKYGLEGAGDIHHYETLELKDNEGNVMVPGRGGPGPDRGGIGRSGLTVSSDYEVTFPAYPDSNPTITFYGSEGPRASCTPISNRQYEYDINEDKSQIQILQKKYVTLFVAEVEKYASKIEDITSHLDVSDYE